MKLPLIPLLACLALGALPSAQAQSPSGTPSQQQSYRPGLGDLMTMTVQPRHTKLGLAGRESNWPYAAYELHELEESFERTARVWQKWREFAIDEMIPAVTRDSMAGLKEAIKQGDGPRFAQAYQALTDACNACHQAANRGMIVIQTPQSNPFPDQDFRMIRP